MRIIKRDLKSKLKTRKIVICTSASFYKEALAIEKELKKLGYEVVLPSTAYTMEKTGNYEVNFYKTWVKNPATYDRKTDLMKKHFSEIIESNAILVVNLEKNRQKGYIGGNVLMEMALAFHYQKPIFILNEILSGSPFYEEILGMSPVFLGGDLNKIALDASTVYSDI